MFLQKSEMCAAVNLHSLHTASYGRFGSFTSGSPLFMKKNGNVKLVGMVSNKPWARDRFYVNFIEIALYEKWLNATITKIEQIQRITTTTPTFNDSLSTEREIDHLTLFVTSSNKNPGISQTLAEITQVSSPSSQFFKKHHTSDVVSTSLNSQTSILNIFENKPVGSISETSHSAARITTKFTDPLTRFENFSTVPINGITVKIYSDFDHTTEISSLAETYLNEVTTKYTDPSLNIEDFSTVSITNITEATVKIPLEFVNITGTSSLTETDLEEVTTKSTEPSFNVENISNVLIATVKISPEFKNKTRTFSLTETGLNKVTENPVSNTNVDKIFKKRSIRSINPLQQIGNASDILGIPTFVQKLNNLKNGIRRNNASIENKGNLNLV